MEKYNGKLIFEPLCECPTKCNCNKPPPEGEWDDEVTYEVSGDCPVHNEHPIPSPICPRHGEDRLVH